MITLSQESFLDPNTLQTLEGEVGRLLENLLTEEAIGLQNNLEGLMKRYSDRDDVPPEMIRRYRQLSVALKFLNIGMLDAEDLIALFRESFLTGAWLIGADLRALMSIRFYSTPTTVWPDVAFQLVGALRANQEELGGEALSGWLKRYEAAFGESKHTTLEQTRFLTQDHHAQALFDEERTRLKIILEVFDGLKPLEIPAEMVKRLEEIEQSYSEEGVMPIQPLATTGEHSPRVPQPVTSPEHPATGAVPPQARAQPPPVERPVFEPLPQSPYLPESDSPLDRTPIARPRHEYKTELRDKNEGVVNLRQPPRVSTLQHHPAVSPPPPRPKIVQPLPQSAPAPIPPRPAPVPPQPRPAPHYTAPSSPRPPSLPIPQSNQAPQPTRPPTPTASQSQSVRAAPPPNLPVAKQTHNEGQEITPYRPPERDPFMPHKPKPLPKLSGNVVDLKRQK